MKLRLSHEKGVEILGLDGPVAARDTQVLRAGLSKILKTGKNKIILELPDSMDLAPDAIRELAAFDGLARELSGRIVLARVTPDLKTKIESFAKPPVILCFKDRTEAMNFLAAPPKPEIPLATPAAPPSEEAKSEIESLKNQDRALRSRILLLEQENRRLKEQVVHSTLARRPPADEKDFLERIDFLEAKLEKALSDQGEKGSKKGT